MSTGEDLFKTDNILKWAKLNVIELNEI